MQTTLQSGFYNSLRHSLLAEFDIPLPFRLDCQISFVMFCQAQFTTDLRKLVDDDVLHLLCFQSRKTEIVSKNSPLAKQQTVWHHPSLINWVFNGFHTVVKVTLRICQDMNHHSVGMLWILHDFRTGGVVLVAHTTREWAKRNAQRGGRDERLLKEVAAHVQKLIGLEGKTPFSALGSLQR